MKSEFFEQEHYRIPKMVSIREAAKTGILPENALRAMQRKGELPGCHCGVKYMVNFDKLIEMLNGGCEE